MRGQLSRLVDVKNAVTDTAGGSKDGLRKVTGNIRTDVEGMFYPDETDLKNAGERMSGEVFKHCSHAARVGLHFGTARRTPRRPRDYIVRPE